MRRPHLLATLSSLLLCVPLLALSGCALPAEHSDVQLARDTALLGTQAAARLIVVLRAEDQAQAAQTIEHMAGVRSVLPLRALALLIVDATSAEAALSVEAQLKTMPGTAAVLHEHLTGAADLTVTPTAPPTNPSNPPAAPAPDADAAYRSPAGWAVQASGGYGANVPGGPATGPWDRARGQGIRLAVIDSGVDAAHPDIAPNLVSSVSEVDTTVLPSPCDDGSPSDQAGHGTWTASLAGAASGTGTGALIGVAPGVRLLSFKVLERLPASSGSSLAASGNSIAARCAAGSPGGLLSWVLLGLNDAVAAHADVIQLSLGSLVDLSTGDGAGWKVAFDRAAFAAESAGSVLVAAEGNDSLDFSQGTLLELPAGARGVLAVTASTNPACAEATGSAATGSAACVAAPAAHASYTSTGLPGEVAAPGGAFPAAADPLTAPSGLLYGACSSVGVYGCFDIGPAAYVAAQGSSGAAALTAGAAALLRSAHPAWTPTQVVAALRSTSRRSPELPEGELDTAAAMAATP